MRERATVLRPALGPQRLWKGESPQIFLGAPRRETGTQLRPQAPSFPARGLRRTQWWARIRPWRAGWARVGERAWAAEPLGRMHSSSGVRNNNNEAVVLPLTIPPCTPECSPWSGPGTLGPISGVFLTAPL